MFKIALDAGHGLYTAGKRCDVKIDPNETREWTLNSRICNKIQQYLKDYEGYELLRVDDTTGKTDVDEYQRCVKANNFNADFYLSVHHNAGINRGSGGGLTTFVYLNVDEKTLVWQRELYDAIIKHTGLRGNRATPNARADFCVLRETNMPAVLIECGFMDSTTDVPIILTEDFADEVAKACVEVIVSRGGLTKKTTKPTQTTTAKTLYRVQVGAFENKANAENLLAKLKAEGYSGIIVSTEKEVAEVKPVEPVKTIGVGSTVKVKAGAKTYTGGGLADYVYKRNHTVKEINGDRVVITYGNTVVCAIHKDSLILI